MYRVYETIMGSITIGQYYILINNTVYKICSEQQSMGEWEDYDMQNVEAYEIANTTTNEKYYLEVFRHTIIILPWSPEKDYYYSYRLRSTK